MQVASRRSATETVVATKPRDAKEAASGNTETVHPFFDEKGQRLSGGVTGPLLAETCERRFSTLRGRGADIGPSVAALALAALYGNQPLRTERVELEGRE